jgi:succinyl-diaminopimelate desuccinylase
VIDHCIVGEPTSAAQLGDMVKIGRRGSLNALITVRGVQGHVAYPDRAANPVAPMVDLLKRLNDRVLDEGYPGFQPSNLEVTTVDVGNPTTNLIPGEARARLNIRFNPHHTGAGLQTWIESEAEAVQAGFAGRISVETQISGEAFLTEPGDFTRLISETISRELGVTPDLSTTGGTSDARFIRALCPVVEVGLVGATMHKIDEQVPVADVRRLAGLYRALIEAYFARFG